MNEVEQTANWFIRFWPVLVSIVLLVAWFVRLEARQYFHEKNFETYRSGTGQRIDNLEKSNIKTVGRVSKIEGKLDIE